MPVVIKHVGRHAQSATLQFPTINRQHGIARSKAGHDVGAAGNACKMNIRLDAFVHVIEALGQQRRAGGKNRTQRRQYVRAPRHDARLFDGVNVLRTGPKQSKALCLSVVPQDATALSERRTVVEHARRPGRQPRDEPIPHHPTGRGKVENAVAVMHVRVQHMLFQMLQQGATHAMHHALGHARGAARIHDDQRMIKREAFEGDFACSVG